MGKFDELGDAVRSVIRAYHGSPHDFDRFDASKIGTGEGAQAYGHGLYFAGDERVAKDYRTKLAGAPVGWTFEMGGGDVWPRLREFPDDVQRGLLELHARLGIWKDPSDPTLLRRAREDLAQTLKNFDSGSIPMEPRVYQSYADALRVLGDPDFRVRPASTPGHTYEVEIGHPESGLLDLDAPMSQQSDAVKAGLANIDPRRFGAVPHEVGAGSYGGLRWKTPWDTLIGHPVRNKPPEALTFLDTALPTRHSRAAYADLAAMARSEAKASQAMREAGIPGIRYLDAGSRTVGEGTRNYVMFPGTEDSIRILRKFAVPGAVGVGAASMGGDGDQ